MHPQGCLQSPDGMNIGLCWGIVVHHAPQGRDRHKQGMDAARCHAMPCCTMQVARPKKGFSSQRRPREADIYNQNTYQTQDPEICERYSEWSGEGREHGEARKGREGWGPFGYAECMLTHSADAWC